MESIGVEDADTIPDDQISYSSVEATDVDEGDVGVGRLMGRPWSPATNEEDEYLQVILSSPYDINTVVTQGADGSYVSQFYVTYLQEGAGDIWQTIKEPDNEDRKVGVFPHSLNNHFTAFGKLCIP